MASNHDDNDASHANEHVDNVDKHDENPEDTREHNETEDAENGKHAEKNGEDSKHTETEDGEDGHDSKPGRDEPVTEQDGPAATPWQAVFSPQYNAYYFFNTQTQEVTWENPLQPSASASASSSTTPAPEDPASAASTSTATPYATQYAALEAAAVAAGIDPALAHLDPSLLASLPGAKPSTTGLPPSFTAKFNARTGQFARPDARDPSHLSEHARAARMSEFYFDVGKWEEQLAQQGGSIMGGENEEGKKRKRPSKKDLDRFKEQKKQKKLAKTAWLRT